MSVFCPTRWDVPHFDYFHCWEELRCCNFQNGWANPMRSPVIKNKCAGHSIHMLWKRPIWLSKLSHYTCFMITTPSDVSLSMYKWLLFVLNEFPHTQKENTVKRAEEILALFSPVGTSGGKNDWKKKKTLIFNVNRPEWDSKSPRAHGCNLASTYESHTELVSYQRGDQDGEGLAWRSVRMQ